MKKIVFAVTLLMGLQSLQAYDSFKAVYTHSVSWNTQYIKICIDNVWYIRSDHKLSVWINPKTLKPSNCIKPLNIK